MQTHIYKHCILIISIAAAVLLAACSGDDWTAEGTPQGGQPEVRPLVDHEVTVALDDAKLHINYRPDAGTQGLQLSWQARETLGVYIKKTNGSLIYAGTIGSTGTEGGREAHRFYGKISEKQDGESYIYLYPAPAGETQGQVAQGTIDFTTQRGTLGSTAHLGGLIPLVWREEGNRNRLPENQGYALHLTLTMKEDPGTINSITLHTMHQGDDGTTPDRIFPKAFKAANLLNEVNSTLPSAKTSGLTLGEDDYTDAITLTPAAGNTFTATHEDDIWKVDAYLAAASIKNLDVFRTKYNVKIDAEHGTFYSDFRSFPGQDADGVNATTGLNMLTNAKCYNLSVQLSKDYSMTIISDKYRVNSLLGMWNDFGKVYDPLNLIAYPGGSAVIAEYDVPQQLKDNKDAILDRYVSQKASNGSPTWLGVGENTLYKIGRPDDKQEDVKFNNIHITAPTEVYITFISDFAWNRNLLGYYHYPTANESTIKSSDVKNIIIFPDFSKPGHEPFAKGEVGHTDGYNIGTPAQAPLQEFQTVKLLYTDANGYESTIFPAGTTIGFMMMIDVKATTTTLMTWSQWRIFTNSVWNKENTTSHGASANWTNTYARNNFFASGDVGSDASGTLIPGLAIYGVKDKAGDNNENTAYGAMIFMVSTTNPSAMQTQNTAYFNIGTGATIIAK